MQVNLFLFEECGQFVEQVLASGEWGAQLRAPLREWNKLCIKRNKITQIVAYQPASGGPGIPQRGILLWEVLTDCQSVVG